MADVLKCASNCYLIFPDCATSKRYSLGWFTKHTHSH